MGRSNMHEQLKRQMCTYKDYEKSLLEEEKIGQAFLEAEQRVSGVDIVDFASKKIKAEEEYARNLQGLERSYNKQRQMLIEQENKKNKIGLEQNRIVEQKLQEEEQNIQKELQNLKSEYQSGLSRIETNKLSELDRIKQHYEQEKTKLEKSGGIVGISEEKELMQFLLDEQKIDENYQSSLEAGKQEQNQKKSEFESKLKELLDEKSEFQAIYDSEALKYHEKIEPFKELYERNKLQLEQRYEKAKEDFKFSEGDLEEQKKQIVHMHNKNVQDLKWDYKSLEKEFNWKIADAESSGKATTRLKSSKETKLQENKRAQLKEENIKKTKLAQFEEEKNSLLKSYENKMHRIKEEMDRLDRRFKEDTRDSYEKLELIEHNYQNGIQELDAKIAACKQDIEDQNITEEMLGTKLKEKKSYEMSELLNRKIEYTKKIGEYQKRWEHCTKPFAIMEEQKEEWVNLVQILKTYYFSSRVEMLMEKERDRLFQLSAKEREQLIVIRERFEILPKELPGFVQKGKLIILLIAGISIVLGGFCISQVSTMSGLLLFILGGIGIKVVMWFVDKVVTAYLSVYLLAENYKSLPAIEEEIVLSLQREVFPEMERRGRLLLSEENTRIQKKEKNEYDKKNLYKKYQHDKAVIEKGAELEKVDLKDDYESRCEEIKQRQIQKRNAFAEEMSDVTKIQIETNKKLDKMKEVLEKKKLELKKGYEIAAEKLDEQEKYVREYHSCKNKYNKIQNTINSYRETYYQLADNIQGYKPGDEEADYILNDSLYVIPEYEKVLLRKETSLQIFQVEHKKRPFVILYNEEEVNNLEEKEMLISAILKDFLNAFCWVNNEDIYSQYIINMESNIRLTEFENGSIRRKYNIIDSGETLTANMKMDFQELSANRRKLAESGYTIHEMNEKYFINKKQPYMYHILYLVMKEGLKGTGLNDEIMKLMPKGHEYGFLTVFVCGKKDWISKKELGEYIQNFTEDRVFVFENGYYEKFMK